MSRRAQRRRASATPTTASDPSAQAGHSRIWSRSGAPRSTFKQDPGRGLGQALGCVARLERALLEPAPEPLRPLLRRAVRPLLGIDGSRRAPLQAIVAD